MGLYSTSSIQKIFVLIAVICSIPHTMGLAERHWASDTYLFFPAECSEITGASMKGMVLIAVELDSTPQMCLIVATQFDLADFCRVLKDSAANL
jgi:hypothetical protein